MSTPQDIQDAIRQVHDQESFIQCLLTDALNWPIDLGFNPRKLTPTELSINLEDFGNWPDPYSNRYWPYPLWPNPKPETCP